MAKEFDSSLKDSQGTAVSPVTAAEFPFGEYEAYSRKLEEYCADFISGKINTLVYRRFRVPEVFASVSADMKRSLELQLGALKESMEYAGDIPNFLEPWYGIGTIASAFGCEYIWHEDQAPATVPPFSSFKEALEIDPVEIENTPIGKHTLDMTEYFLEKTKGRLPMSLSDVQSPLNASGYLVDTNNYYLGLYDDPENFKLLLERIVDLMVQFYKKQMEMIGSCLVLPGHGFASSRVFTGVGMSDDNITMLSPDLYRELVLPAVNRFSVEMGGVVFHSCGNWSNKIDVVKEMKGLYCVDGAFSSETDPDPNPVQPFLEAFDDGNVILNIRLVGSPEDIGRDLRTLASSSVKTIMVTYGRNPKEQKELYTLCRNEI
ncbi:uroporphyrinogen decarboxylase family protein [Marispirochaeta sp.]|jgi:hypothetical protein|uniref:uroporphyrinogen decarboxylase family protein n=1 Tax=Marispirochaeta sp. TaxID=2038653 RepID=UPI0029C675E4|nr:uroporphyrinogen decarboxylase family protein [Marispirochaeta sp.]